MPATYEPIATTTLGSAVNTISFTSIGSGYTDLRLVLVGTSDTSTPYIIVRFNNDSTSLYSTTRIGGNGTTAASARNSGTGAIIAYEAALSSTPSFYSVDLFSYTGSTFKTFLSTISNDKNGSGQAERSVGLYRSTTAITRFDIITSSNNFAAGTTATLYGILKA